MNRFCFSFVVFVGVSCSSRPDVTIRNLNFPDYELPARVGTPLQKTFVLAGNDTIETRVYDSLGRVISDHDEEWSYDSFGIPIHRILYSFDIISRFRASYSFDHDSLILYQSWKGYGRGSYDYVCKFQFDSEGFLLSEFNNDSHTSSGAWAFTRKYQYNKDKKVVRVLSEQFMDGVLQSSAITDIFYSRDHDVIDSIYSESMYDNDRFKTTHCYDASGLISKTIQQEQQAWKGRWELRYIHQKR